MSMLLECGIFIKDREGLVLVFASLGNDDNSDDFVACGPLAHCYVDHPGV